MEMPSWGFSGTYTCSWVLRHWLFPGGLCFGWCTKCSHICTNQIWPLYQCHGDMKIKLLKGILHGVAFKDSLEVTISAEFNCLGCLSFHCIELRLWQLSIWLWAQFKVLGLTFMAQDQYTVFTPTESGRPLSTI